MDNCKEKIDLGHYWVGRQRIFTLYYYFQRFLFLNLNFHRLMTVTVSISVDLFLHSVFLSEITSGKFMCFRGVSEQKKKVATCTIRNP